jgi:hypothetical protein
MTMTCPCCDDATGHHDTPMEAEFSSTGLVWYECPRCGHREVFDTGVTNSG